MVGTEHVNRGGSQTACQVSTVEQLAHAIPFRREEVTCPHQCPHWPPLWKQLALQAPHAAAFLSERLPLQVLPLLLAVERPRLEARAGKVVSRQQAVAS